MSLDKDTVRLAKGKNLASVVTLMPDGQPQALLTWVDTDGDHILINTEPQRQRAKNIDRDPRITVLIHSAEDPMDWSEVRGEVVETVNGQVARDHIDELSQKYTGHDYANPIGKAGRVILKVAGSKVNTPAKLALARLAAADHALASLAVTPDNLPAPATTFAELLLRRAEDDRPALLFDEVIWTWRELIVQARRRAALMAARPLDGPRHVGVLLENTPEYVAWIYGAALARTTIVGINPTRRGDALRDDIRHTDCGLIVTDADRLGLVASLDLGLADDRTLLIDSSEYDDELAATEPLDSSSQHPEPSDRLLLLFTSGSTGAPKAVVCTTGRLAGTATGAVRSLGILADDVLYQAMPLFHGNAIMANLAPALALAAPVVLRRRFSASQFLSDVRRYDATYFNYVGRSLAYVLATPEFADDGDNTLRLGFGTEASLRDRERFIARFGCDLLETYGSSEGVISTHRPPGAPPQSIGMPQPRPGSDVAVVDADTGAECPPAVFDTAGALINGDEAIGEIVDRGGAVGFEGYYRNEAATSERIRDGWYWSGDLAYRDEAGYFYFAGRSLDWLRVDSENFAAAPVEAVLSRHPDVVMAAVYAVPDPQTGDQVMAALELRNDATFDPAGFAGFLAAQADLGTKWAPTFVRLVAAMPLTATNKVNKAPLRRTAWETQEPVFVRDRAAESYVAFTATARAEHRAAFGEHSRTDLLPHLAN